MDVKLRRSVARTAVGKEVGRSIAVLMSVYRTSWPASSSPDGACELNPEEEEEEEGECGVSR